jgi:DNA (cytosine-5)-methyltransferase 1
VKFVSLFAGIGGFDLGLKRAGMTCVGQVEIDPYCRDVLAKHWPDVPRMEDVCDFQGHEFGQFDYLVAGFPCQDVSNAGRRAGLSGERSGLYREVVRAIRLVRPIGAVLENVAALLARGMGTVLGDLAEVGYDAEWDCIPACAVGAPHIRDRVFIVANHWEERTKGHLPKEVSRQPAFSWCEDVGGIEDLRGRSGLPPSIFRGTRDGVPDWVGRVAGCGNAVVPQVAEVIGRSIMEAHNKEAVA